MKKAAADLETADDLYPLSTFEELRPLSDHGLFAEADHQSTSVEN